MSFHLNSQDFPISDAYYLSSVSIFLINHFLTIFRTFYRARSRRIPKFDDLKEDWRTDRAWVGVYRQWNFWINVTCLKALNFVENTTLIYHLHCADEKQEFFFIKQRCIAWRIHILYMQKVQGYRTAQIFLKISIIACLYIFLRQVYGVKSYTINIR